MTLRVSTHNENGVVLHGWPFGSALSYDLPAGQRSSATGVLQPDTEFEPGHRVGPHIVASSTQSRIIACQMPGQLAPSSPRSPRGAAQHAEHWSGESVGGRSVFESHSSPLLPQQSFQSRAQRYTEGLDVETTSVILCALCGKHPSQSLVL